MNCSLFARLIFCAVAITTPPASILAQECPAIERAESDQQLTQEQLNLKRKEIMERYDESAAAAICASSAALSYEGFKQELARADRRNRNAGGTEYDHGELYFYLQCGENLVNLSPLTYHAHNLNRDDQGYIGEMTLSIIWMSIGYLNIKDPEHGRSFMDAVNRILTYARKKEMIQEIEIHENLLTEIEEFSKDYQREKEECQE